MRLVKSVNTVFVSQFQRAGLSGKAEVIYNGIPLDMWSKPHFSSGRYLAFLGAINETKGTHEAIKAALLANEPIIVAGTTDENGEYFQRKIKPFVDGDQVKYIGSLNFKQKQSFLAEAKAVLMPIQWDDPLPTVALESLAFRNSSHRLESLINGGNYREWQVWFSRIVDRGDGSESKGS